MMAPRSSAPTALSVAVATAEHVLTQPPSSADVDPRWQAIVDLAEHIPARPEEVWGFIKRWGTHGDDDVRAAVATCLLEHLLEHHFDRFFPLVQEAALDPRFGDTFSLCWKYGQADMPGNARKFDHLRRQMAERRRRSQSQGD